MGEKSMFWFSIIMVILVLGLLALGIAGCVYDERIDKYCDEKYPGIPYGMMLKGSWGSTLNAEPGHIECCRYIYVDHKRTEECEVIEYDKEKS